MSAEGSFENAQRTVDTVLERAYSFARLAGNPCKFAEAIQKSTIFEMRPL